jgi:orotidine-5'-phosphate decarboxylase
MTKATLDPPACVALDVPSLDEARALLDAVRGMVPVFKIGLQLFCAEGPRAVEEVHSRGADVFLDLKMNDIPKTVASGIRSAVGLGVRFVTVHSNAGRGSVRAAVDAADGKLDVLVVSVLTSLADADIRDVGIERSVADQVDAMARLAVDEEAPGLVLAAGEVSRVRAAHPDLFLVTPGIRPRSIANDDQARIATPAAAIAAGSDMLVLARALIGADDPRSALEEMLRDIDGARAPAAPDAPVGAPSK